MENKGLTLSIIFEAESANYGESFGNISSLKKLSRGDGNNNTKVSNADKVVQFEKDASIENYPEIDFFGYMKTGKNSVNGSSNTRNAVVRLSNAIALESYNSDLDFLTNMALAKRGGMDNAIAQSEIHKSYYAYTVTIDLDKVGIDEIIKDKENNKDKHEIDNKEKAKRVKELLKVLKTLYRDIRGRRENLSPIFIIGGVYNIKNPFFENRLKVNKNNLEIKTITDVLDLDTEIKNNTICGLVDSMFSNTEEIKKELKGKLKEESEVQSVSYVIDELSKKVDEYYA